MEGTDGGYVPYILSQKKTRAHVGWACFAQLVSSGKGRYCVVVDRLQRATSSWKNGLFHV